MNILIVAVPVIIIAFLPVPAHAYLDVGSASMVLQMILAALVGAGVSIILYWQRVCKFIRKLFSSNNPKDNH